nr:PREDICTED: zinc-binding protein A33-like [Latimeria chalumnae]|eukprot:XP_006001226.1 PREDICTED: zinc-binding protein A33-like [Latimeria chalumnae]
MSSLILAESLTSEVTCPICHEFYKDPVRLECEHNFCRACISRYWSSEEEGGFTCPLCREIFPQLQLKTNRLLASIVERVRRLRVGSPADAGATGLCERHEEKLKLFCEDDQQAICVVCGVSRDHKGHKMTPLHEAAQYFKEKLEEAKQQFDQQRASLKTLETQQQKKISDVKETAAALKAHIISEYEVLQRFLAEEQRALLAELRAEEEKLVAEMERNLEEIAKECSSLQRSVKDFGNWPSEDDSITLLMEMKKINERVSSGFKVCGVLSGDLNVGKFRGPLQYAAWKRMRAVVTPAPTPLTFDPESANPYLALSDDLRSARYSYAPQELPENPERFDFCACVLAAEGFSTGRHYWEVDVGDRPDWDLGITAASADRDSWVILTPENGYWTFGHVSHRQVGILLDYEAGQLSFYSADTLAHLHTFAATFSEKVYPFFYPSADSNAQPLRLLHPEF